MAYFIVFCQFYSSFPLGLQKLLKIIKDVAFGQVFLPQNVSIYPKKKCIFEIPINSLHNSET